MRTIKIKIDADPKMCRCCSHKEVVSTGLAGEWHATCTLFGGNGKWREHDMRRVPECLKAEKQARE